MENHIPFLWFKKSIQKLSRLCPETSTKLYVHEFSFCTVLPLEFISGCIAAIFRRYYSLIIKVTNETFFIFTSFVIGQFSSVFTSYWQCKDARKKPGSPSHRTFLDCFQPQNGLWKTSKEGYWRDFHIISWQQARSFVSFPPTVSREEILHTKLHCIRFQCAVHTQIVCYVFL